MSASTPSSRPPATITPTSAPPPKAWKSSCKSKKLQTARPCLPPSTRPHILAGLPVTPCQTAGGLLDSGDLDEHHHAGAGNQPLGGATRALRNSGAQTQPGPRL